MSFLKMTRIFMGIAFIASFPGLLSAADPLVPDEAAGQAVFVAYPRTMKLEANLDAWKDLPLQSVDRGPMKSKDPLKNGSFAFSLAADDARIYILMLAKDNAIVCGLHGSETWNEDSMEFYLNFSGRLGARKYLKDAVQYRLSPVDIGKTDSSDLTLSGTNSSLHPLKATVFRTADGWGFVAAVDFPEGFQPAHGKSIGFQAQLNGASKKDRDVKLIWSDADTADNSWQDPSLFGQAVFYKIGSGDKPLPAPIVAEALHDQKHSQAAGPDIAINQLGYLTRGPKKAAWSTFGTQPLPWKLIDVSDGSVAAEGQTEFRNYDLMTGDSCQVVDFSAFHKAGKYRLGIGEKVSPDFLIGDDVLANLSRDALRYFYRSRSGTDLKPEFAGQAWARPAGYLSDDKVAAFGGKDPQGKTWDSYPFTVDGSKGWYDAGDFGKYVVNGGIALWTLQNSYERLPSHFADGQIGLPESGTGKPDILSESRWELEFMLNMQIPAGHPLEGLCFLKLHDRVWSGMPSPLPSRYDNNTGGRDDWSWGRFVYEPSTSATLNMAACAAQASRLWSGYDPSFASRCLASSERAWAAALKNPDLKAGNVPGNGGGNYDGSDLAGDFFWAASELYLTTGKAEYLQYLKRSSVWKSLAEGSEGKASAMGWADTGALGEISLLGNPGNRLSREDFDYLKAGLLKSADHYAEIAGQNAYGAALSVDGYAWGSNSAALNNAIILAVAYDLGGGQGYRDVVAGTMNYLLGFNALHKSFITGYGVNPPIHPHHRIWANDPDAGYPAPPPGVLVGGANKNLDDPEMKAAGLANLPMAKRYLDMLGSFATNEVAINWNAPLVWVSSWLDATEH